MDYQQSFNPSMMDSQMSPSGGNDTIFIIIILVLLIALGGLGFWFWYYWKHHKSNTAKK